MTTSPTYAQLREIAVKNAGDEATQELQAAFDSGGTSGVPSEDDGVDISASYLPLWGILLNRSPGKTTKYLRIDALVDSDTFTITLDGSPTNVSPDPGASELETLADIAEAIDAISGYTAFVETQPDGSTHEVVIQKDSAFTLAFSASSSTVSNYAEATSVDFKIWARLKHTTGDVFKFWGEVNPTTTITANALDRLIARSVDRAYIEIISTDGRVYTLFGV